MDVDDVASVLYALPPEEFTTARDDAVRAAPDAGTKQAIKSLRKPTAGAHAVNQLVRERAADVDALIALGNDLSAAMARDPAEVRRLTQERRDAIAALVPPGAVAAVQADVTATLEAATADPDLAAAVRTGRLVKPLRYAGFGTMPDLDDAVASVPAATRKPPAKKPSPAKKSTPAKPPAADLTPLRERVLELAGIADDATRRYEQAARTAEDARRHLEQSEQERAAAHKAARAAHAEADKARRELGKLERS